ncbi:DUF3021 family protein [Fructilactobacillus sanfranciscensis]|nr:DUF3021 family protein [Fructilactobacillus sanfranciscensis]
MGNYQKNDCSFHHYLSLTPLAILAGWFPLQLNFMISFTIIFVFIYIWMWGLSFYKAKQTLKLINQEMNAHEKAN